MIIAERAKHFAEEEAREYGLEEDDEDEDYD